MDELIKSLPYCLQLAFLFGPAISVFIAAIALSLNVRQTTLNNKLNRAKLADDSLRTFLADDIMQNTFYKIEYGRFEYEPSAFHDSEEECEIDKLLHHFSNFALLWRHGLLGLGPRDLKYVYPFQYYILRIMNDPEIIRYLSFIKDKWMPMVGIRDHPYLALQSLAEALRTTGQNFSK